jgi:hypothetical protein
LAIFFDGKTDGMDDFGRSVAAVHPSATRCGEVQFFSRVDNRVEIKNSLLKGQTLHDMTWFKAIFFINFLLCTCSITFAAKPLAHLHVVVALVDNASQGIVPVPAKIGNGDDAFNNLYWGAGFGVKTFLSRAQGWKKLGCEKDISSVILERCRFAYLDSLVVTAEAWRGRHIDQAMLAFMQVAAKPPAPQAREMVMFVGHDGLMDAVHAKLPQSFAKHVSHGKQAAVLACYSDRFFRHHLEAAGAQPSVTTYSLMAPEGYVVEAIARSFAGGGDPVAQRRAAGLAYAAYQRITPRAGLGVFGVR